MRVGGGGGVWNDFINMEKEGKDEKIATVENIHQVRERCIYERW